MDLLPCKLRLKKVFLTFNLLFFQACLLKKKEAGILPLPFHSTIA